MFGRRKVAAVVGEFLGTATLAFVVLNVSRSTIGIPYFVAIAAGLAVALMGLSVATDVHLNPALTLGLWTARRVKTAQAVVYIAAQLLGGWAAYGLYKYFVHGTVQHVSSGFEGRILVAEAVGAFIFTMAASAVLYERIWGLRRALVVGAAFVLGMMVASASSNGFINPAVALGSNSWGWGTYVLGPVLGAIIGVNLYALLFSGLDGAPASAKASVGSASKSTSKSKKK
jgi:glycerol uptake facilitator-like aquaporin